MTEKNPKKKYFKPKKPVDQMTEEELDEFAKFVFDNLCLLYTSPSPRD